MSHTQNLDALLEQTGWIHALARRLAADPHLAADLAQDTCIVALDAEPDADRSLRGWIATAMRNRLAKLRRGETNRASRERSASRDEALVSAHDVVEKAETHRNVVLAVLALEEPYRSTLLMRYFEELPYAEIARRTGVTRASVNSRISRGLERLRQRLETTYGGDRRALSLALIPLATPTRVASTLLGVNTMHLAIGTTALTLVAVTVSVGLNLISDDLEPQSVVQPADIDSRRADPIRSDSPDSIAAVLHAPPAEPARDALEGHRVAVATSDAEAPPREVRDVWKTEVFRSIVLAPTVETVSVNASSGDIELLDSPSGGLEIQAKVHAEVGVAEKSGMTSVFEDHVEIIEEKGSIRIEDRHRGTRGWTVDFVVRVPSSIAASLNNGSGDIVLRRAQGKLNVNTGSGDIEMRVAPERIQALQANTGSGDVVIEAGGVEGELKLNTGSGDLKLFLATVDSPGTVHLNAGSGDLTLVVPAEVTGSFDLETSGDSIELPGLFTQAGIQVKEEASGRKRAQGSIGVGGGKYTLRSGSGEIAVQAGPMKMKRKSTR